MPTRKGLMKLASSASAPFAERCMAVLKLSELRLKSAEISRGTGLNETTVRHMILVAKKMTGPVFAKFADGKFEFGHARVIAGLEDALQEDFADRLIARGWSVRRAKDEAAALKAGAEAERQGVGSGYFKSLEEKLSEQIGHQLTIKPAGSDGKGGSICIHYANNEMFESVLDLLGVDLSEIN